MLAAISAKVYQQEIWHPIASRVVSRGILVTVNRQDVIGCHFFSPANVMKLLELFASWNCHCCFVFFFWNIYCPEVERQFFGWFSVFTTGLYANLAILSGWVSLGFRGMCEVLGLPLVRVFLGVPSEHNMTSWDGFVDFLGGGLSQIFVIFTPNHGEDSHFDVHIFQWGWNHQPVLFGFCWPFFCYKKTIIMVFRGLVWLSPWKVNDPIGDRPIFCWTMMGGKVFWGPGTSRIWKKGLWLFAGM